MIKGSGQDQDIWSENTTDVEGVVLVNRTI